MAPETKPLWHTPLPTAIALALAIGLSWSIMAPTMLMAAPAEATQAPQTQTRAEQTFTEEEVIAAAGDFFGGVSKGLADGVHTIFSKYGEPNAYIKGEEASGAIVIGLRYGRGDLVMKAGSQTKVYWQGPSAGWDFGGDAVKVFTLVYNLPDSQTIYQRFPGVEGSAYFVGGIGINYQQRGDVILAPMRSGLGLRLGASVGYLKYTPTQEWLPF
ncbi:MAG: DUF1134 domain-containing protein [Rhizobiales bacterium]|nr:DUF1134 domain-containing protein [Hyphomicrobiales bacterium]